MLIQNLNLYRNEERRFVRGELLIEDGIIRGIGQDLSHQGKTVDGGGAYVVPGLLDVHTHGRAGYDFISAPAEVLGAMAADYARHGVVAVMPTLASAELGEMFAATERLCRFDPKRNEAAFFGVHWEGRYLNPQKKGAHAPHMLAPLTAAELDSEVFRMCPALHISAAYELDEDGGFAKKALSIGATLGLGHTAATYAQAKSAEERGVTSYTHLYNTMPPLHHRDGGVIAAALLGNATAELICDGIHVAPEMVHLAYRMKGAERLSLISDSMEATGGEDGQYSIAGNPVVVKNGIARTPDGALAGSTLNLDDAVNNLMKFCEIPLTEAIISATEAPAKQMGVYDTYGSIDVGKRADLLFLESPEQLKNYRVMLRGKWADEIEN